MTESLREQSAELIAELAEVGIDQLCDSGVLRDIPILGTAVKLASLGSDVRDALFMKKVARFLNELTEGHSGSEEHERFVRSYSGTVAQTKKVGETIALLLDRMNDMDKPSMLAQLFSSLVKGRITFDQFRRLANALDIAFVGDLILLQHLKGNVSDEHPDYLEFLIGSGLAKLSRSGVPAQVLGGSVTYHGVQVSELGRLFIEATEARA